MLSFPQYIKRNERKLKQDIISFQGWPLGENTSVPAFQLKSQELASCIDLKYNRGGQLETRGAIVKYSDTQIGSVEDIKAVSLGGTQYTLCSDSDNKKVYYFNSLTPTEIGTAENAPKIVPYNDVALICDNSYLKYCDDTSGLKIAYDTADSQYDNYSGDDDSELKVGDGTNTRIATKFTSQSWDLGYTIPITKVEVMLKKTGAPTGTIACKLRLVSTDAVQATKNFSEDAADISTTSTYYSVTFAAGDITHEMSQGTDYYVTIEHSGGDVSNYIGVRCTDVSSGVAYVYSGSWAADTTADPIMKVYPSRPPKAAFGKVSGNRPWIKNPDEPGRVYFGNLTHLDWSTSNGGGWVGVVDDNANSFEIGGFEDLYGSLYIFGKENHPFVCKLEGSIPSAYSLPLLFQQSWTTADTLVNTNNDLWFSSATGTDNLAGVQEYGDLRTFSVSDPIKDAFDDWSSSAIAGYHPADGQYWLYLGQTYVHVCHTKQPTRLESGEVRYPWSRYELPAVPTCFQQAGSNFLIGSSDGFIYTFDSNSYKDLDTIQIDPEFKTAYVELPFKTVDLIRYQLLASSINGSYVTIDFYKNGNRSDSELTKNLSLAISDAVTLADIQNIVLSDLENVALNPVGSVLYFDLNINCYSVQIKISSIKIVGHPVYINGMVLKYNTLEE